MIPQSGRAGRRRSRQIPGAVLIVGHSNTVPDLVARFGGEAGGRRLTDQDYGTIFVVTPDDGKLSEIKIRAGSAELPASGRAG